MNLKYICSGSLLNHIPGCAMKTAMPQFSRTFIFFLLLFFMSFSDSSAAPTCLGSEIRQQRYNSGKLEFCDGSHWHLIGTPEKLPSNFGCTTANSNKQIYNSNRMEYCDTSSGEDILYLTNVNNCGQTTATCSAGLAGKQQFDIPNHVMEYCDGSHWINMGYTPFVPAMICCPTGFIPVPASPVNGVDYNFCVAKYHMKAKHKNTGNISNGGGNVNVNYPASVPNGTPWGTINFNDAFNECASLGSDFHLITNAEWMTIAKSIELNPVNWSGNVVGTGYIPRGHSDGTPNNTLAASANDASGCQGYGNNNCINKLLPDYHQKRTLTLSNGEVIWDFAGNINTWVSSNTAGNSVLYTKLDSSLCPNSVSGPCNVQLNKSYSTDLSGRMFSIISPFMYPPSPSQSTNKKGFLPANDPVWGAAGYSSNYSEHGFGMISWLTGTGNTSLQAIALYRGGHYGQFNSINDQETPNPVSGQSQGGIYSAWLTLNRNTNSSSLGFRCVYVPY